MDEYDIAIIGGGINGVGIARDAAGRGLSVHLCEQGDLASGTSSAATKLIHGGLRYLEHREFRLVRHALQEREVLWGIAPHIIRPLRFVLPHHRGLRPAWLLRLGLFLYDHIGGRKLLPATSTLDLSRHAAGAPLKPGLFARGFEYSDCWVEDARLVVLNARDAVERGARVVTRTAATAARREDDGWRIELEDRRDGARTAIRARILVNAAGPWAGRVLDRVLGMRGAKRIRLVQGSHIVVPRLYDHDRCYIFQNADGRIVFAIPYEDDFTLIGTTDRDYEGDPGAVTATEEEVAYLCEAVSTYFARPVRPTDVVWRYAGVRPLVEDGAKEAQAATRDYVLELDGSGPPLLSVLGGKLTTYRRLAEDAMALLEPHLPPAARGRRSWTGTEPLPGGDFPRGGTQVLAASLKADHPWLDPEHARRLARLYGTRATRILAGAGGAGGLGRAFGASLTEAELDYLMREEWAETAEDVVWRRSKLGLRLTPGEIEAIDAHMSAARR